MSFAVVLMMDYLSAQVYTITDRGPNQGCDDLADAFAMNRPGSSRIAEGKGFPLEKFAPTVTQINLTEGFAHVNGMAGGLIIKKMMPLKYKGSRKGPAAWDLEKYGEYSTGRGNKPPFMEYDSTTTLYGKDCFGYLCAQQIGSG